MDPLEGISSSALRRSLYLLLRYRSRKESERKKSLWKVKHLGGKGGGKRQFFHPWLMMICLQSAMARCVEQTLRGHTRVRTSVNNSASLLKTMTQSLTHTPHHTRTSRSTEMGFMIQNPDWQSVGNLVDVLRRDVHVVSYIMKQTGGIIGSFWGFVFAAV